MEFLHWYDTAGDEIFVTVPESFDAMVCEQCDLVILTEHDQYFLDILLDEAASEQSEWHTL